MPQRRLDGNIERRGDLPGTTAVYQGVHEPAQEGGGRFLHGTVEEVLVPVHDAFGVVHPSSGLQVVLFAFGPHETLPIFLHVFPRCQVQGRDLTACVKVFATYG